ncbi:MAG: hypothetical protein KJ077_48805 [Anaerolineae bacterium]|nr:hypothetical protein [Anaerolineae bacterium]
MSRRIRKIVVSLLSVLVLLSVGYAGAKTPDTSTIRSKVMFSPNLAFAVPLSNDFSHRYVVFLDGIRSESSADDSPLNGDFDFIQDQLKDMLGIDNDHFIYFSYSAASDRVVPVYCLGWGLEACSDSRDLTSLNLSPIYDVEDTQLSIDRQTPVLTWLINQILKQDPSAKIDLGSVKK